MPEYISKEDAYRHFEELQEKHMKRAEKVKEKIPDYYERSIVRMNEVIEGAIKENKKHPICFGKFKNDDECENCEFNLDCIDSTKDLKYPQCFGGYKGWCEEKNAQGELRCNFRKVCERKIKESKEYRDCFGEYSVDDNECGDCKYKGECEQITSSRERRKKWWK